MIIPGAAVCGQRVRPFFNDWVPIFQEMSLIGVNTTAAGFGVHDGFLPGQHLLFTKTPVLFIGAAATALAETPAGDCEYDGFLGPQRDELSTHLWVTENISHTLD